MMAPIEGLDQTQGLTPAHIATLQAWRATPETQAALKVLRVLLPASSEGEVPTPDTAPFLLGRRAGWDMMFTGILNIAESGTTFEEKRNTNFEPDYGTTIDTVEEN